MTDWKIPTPRYAGSFYHFSKLFDSLNLDYACRIWGLRVTELNQAPVWGHISPTRLDVDEYFGTVVNRFCAQAVTGCPLTVYGKGEQQRGFIYLGDALKAIEIVINDRPDKGEFRTVHQLTEVLTINEVAELISEQTGCKIQYIENPREEMSKNSFNFECRYLKEKGLKPKLMKDNIMDLLAVMEKYKKNINTNLFMPKTKWK